MMGYFNVPGVGPPVDKSLQIRTNILQVQS